MRRQSLIWAVAMVLLVIAATGIFLSVTSIRTRPAQIALDEAIVQQALKSTVRMVMLFPAGDSDGQSGDQTIVLKAAVGLGTVVAGGGDHLIVTHDHWRRSFSELLLVEFHSAEGELLLEVQGAAFAELIRYRDGGTMMITVPEGLISRLSPAPSPLPATTMTVTPGDVVLVIHQRPDNQNLTDVLTAAVAATGVRNGLPTYELLSLDNQPIVPGDSGGGVFLNGRLVGNLWSTEVDTGERYLGVVTINTGRAATNMSTAAALPLMAEAGE